MNIYFSGIGGVGIGPLAEIAFDAGYKVQGSDINESLTSRELSRRGIAISNDQSGDFLASCHSQNPIDWFVHTSGLPADHPELQKAKELGIKISKRDELISHIIKDKKLKLIAIAGTHGKTTTTAMAVWTLKQLGIPISYSIGSTISFGPAGKFDPSSEYFIYEADEFDRNFLSFHPYISLIVSVDYDHSDTYKTKKEYREAFDQFKSQSETSIETVKINPDITLHGDHNRHNASLVIEMIEKLAIPGDAIGAINSFPGAHRRFEKLSDNIYTDYGHHPAEIAATLQMASELSNNVVLVYQPHQNTRQHEIKDQYADSFTHAKKIYWLPTYLSRENPALTILTPEYLIENIKKPSDIIVSELDETLWKHIQDETKQGNLVLCMGAGSIDSWIREKLR